MIFIILSVLLLSVRGILTKFALEGADIIDIFYFRFLIAIPIMWAITLIFSKDLKALKNLSTHILCFFAGFFGYYLATLSDLISLSLIEVNINRIILYCYPIFVILFNSILQKSPPNKSHIISFIAIIALLSVFLRIDSDYNIKGVIWAFIACISFAIYVVINQESGKKTNSLIFTTMATSYSFLFITIQKLNTASSTMTDVSLNYIIIIAIFCTAMPLLLFSEGIKRIGANNASLLTMSGPIVTFFMSYIILGEKLTSLQIFIALIILGILANKKLLKN